MTHPAIEAIAAAILGAAPPKELWAIEDGELVCKGHNGPLIDEADANRMAHTALRALAEQERDEARRAMLAALVKERDHAG